MLLAKDFAGARVFSNENSHMIKRVVLVVLGFFSLCFSLAAQQTLDAGSAFALYRPEIFSTVDSSVLLRSFPVPNLLDGQRLPISSELGWQGMAPLNLFPNAFLRVAEVDKVNAAPVDRTDGKDSRMDGKDSPGELMALHSSPEIYSGGEIGVFYGKSSGKYGREDFGSYIVGGVGNDRFQMTVGASYEESSGRVPRFRSFSTSR